MTKDEELTALKGELHRLRVDLASLQRELSQYKTALAVLKVHYEAMIRQFKPESIKSLCVGEFEEQK